MNFESMLKHENAKCTEEACCVAVMEQATAWRNLMSITNSKQNSTAKTKKQKITNRSDLCRNHFKFNIL